MEKDTSSKKLIHKKNDVICNYSKSLVENKGITEAKNDINKLKKDILATISSYKGAVDKLERQSIYKNAVLSELKSKMTESDKLAGKILSGTQLKRDVYEENTALTMNLIYYILGMGFMGYYIIKLLKK